MSIFQGTSKKTVVKKLKVDQISKLEFLEQNAVMLCISFWNKGDYLVESYHRFE